MHLLVDSWSDFTKCTVQRWDSQCFTEFVGWKADIRAICLTYSICRWTWSVLDVSGDMKLLTFCLFVSTTLLSPAMSLTPSRVLTLWRLTTLVVVVPHRWPLKLHFFYFFNKYRYWIFKHGIYSAVFFSSKCSLFHNSNIFGSCFIHVLYTGCAKI